jgi:hypothetical protein
MRCYVLLAPALLLALLLAVPAHAEPASWEHHTLDDGNGTEIAMGISEDGGFFLAVGAERPGVGRFITFGGKRAAISPSHAVTFRIDASEPLRFAGPMTDEAPGFMLNKKGNVITLQGARAKHAELLERLRTGSRATVRFRDATGSARTVVIPLKGSGAAIRKVLE